MELLISTNMYTAENVRKVLAYLRPFEYKTGVELFPMFHKTEYEEVLQECLPELTRVPVSFHGPYYGAEHSAPYGTEKYRNTMSMFRKTLEYGRYLNCRYLVFHHNNRRVEFENREEMIRNSCKNFRTAEELCGKYRIPLLVENAGVKSNGNMLFDQDEFVELCKREKYQVLIDIGHAHANGWNLSQVMETLRDQIAAYHLHNNDGIHDSHQRIHNGTLDFGRFAEDCRAFTPDADLVLEYSLAVSDDTEGIMEDIRELQERMIRTDGK